MKILIDIDSTLIESIQMLVKIYNDHNKYNTLTYTPNHGWNVEEIIQDKCELKDLFQYFDHEDFYSNKYIHFTYGAREVINRLSKSYKVVFCSKHNESRKPITSKFIKETFPKAELIFVDNFEDKKQIPCDIIIDDKPECMLDALADYKICFGNYKWNQDWDGVRVTNWTVIEGIIKILEIIDSE